jgi:hypothetical protein
VINGPGKSIQLIDGSNKLFFTSLVEIYKAVMVLLISFFFHSSMFTVRGGRRPEKKKVIKHTCAMWATSRLAF